MKWRFLILLTSLPGLPVMEAQSSASDYLEDVKPLLAHKCYACHGALKQQGGLRLDTAASLLQGGESGAAVMAGQTENSLLMDVLTGEAGFRMPPANEGSPLTDAEIDVVRRWIKAGAPQPEHEEPQTDPQSWWSYQPIRHPSIPHVAEENWCRNEIDYFTAAARDERSLPHTTEASKSMWLRRVFLDLIGLPPTRQELHEFLNNGSPSAFETVVDDLLSRPQYGERWGRHWMDIWRYSDWYGSRGINEIRYSQRHIWRWRDWIVASLNQDQGYDRMIQHMLAADELADGDASILPATGYLGRSWYKFDRDVWLFETAERTAEAFLGLTLRCCRCHDHKFDPITQEEYYRFRAFFEPHDVRTDPVSALTKTHKDATLGQVLTDGIPLVYDKFPERPTFRFERGDNRYPDESKPLAAGVPAALGGTVDVQPVQLPVETWYPMLRPGVRETLIQKADAEVAAAAARLREARETAKAAETAFKTAGESTDTALPPQILLADHFKTARPDVWETVNGSWQYRNGRLIQTEVTGFATMVTKTEVTGDFDIHLRYRPLTPGTYRSVGFSFDYQDKGNSQDVYTSTGDSRQSVQAFHRVGGRQVYPQQGIVYTSLSVGEEAVLDVSVTGSRLIIELNGKQELDYTMPEQRRDGRFALWVHQGAAEFLELKITRRAESRETLERRHQEAVRGVALAEAQLNLAHGEATSVQQRLAADMAKHVTADQEEATRLGTAALKTELTVAVLKARVEVAATIEGSDKHTEAMKQLTAAEQAAAEPAGVYTPVGEQFPRTSTGRRSALADWITDKENPRTARIAVNHIWARHFGQPLVATPENFGLNGRRPTHPTLLDWLAAELMAAGWKMKPLHRKIVLSATYRMSSAPVFSEPEDAVGTEFAARALAAAASADPENQFLWRMNSRRMEAEVVRDATLHLASRLDLTMTGPEIPETEGESNLRRSLYFRNTPNEKMKLLEIFDVADPNACYRRKESVVPHQSLALMNSGLTQDSARILAQQLAEESDFVTAAFETVMARSPTAAEQNRCQQFLRDHQTLLRESSETGFPAGGSSKQLPAQDPVLRARENLIHVLFLHNDFVTIR